MFDGISKFWWPITHDPCDLETQNSLGGNRVHRVTRMQNLSKIGEVMVNNLKIFGWFVVELTPMFLKLSFLFTVLPSLTATDWGAIFCSHPLSRFFCDISKVTGESLLIFQYPSNYHFGTSGRKKLVSCDTSAKNDVRVTWCFPGFMRTKGLRETLSRKQL